MRLIFAILFCLSWTVLNGQINLCYHAGSTTYTISGYLKYDNAPATNQPIANATIYVKNGAEPIPPATTPIPDVIATGITDATGYYSVSVPNGSYYLYAFSPAAWHCVDNSDVTILRNFIIYRCPNPMATCPCVGGYCSPLTWGTVDTLRVRAADVNQDGVVDNGDVTPLRRQIAGLQPNPLYKIANWVFQNPMVTVSGSNQSNINFLGSLSGDLNGDYYCYYPYPY